MQLSGAPLNVIRTNPNDSDISTADTIQKMIQIAKDNASHPFVIAQAHEIATLGNDSVDGVLELLYEFVKGKITFRNDEDLLGEYLGLPPDKELLLTPHFILSSDNVYGDCDDFSTLLATLIIASGIPVNVYFVTICADYNEPNRWSHVYVAVDKGDGIIIYMDASHGPYVGWETTKILKKKLWPVSSIGRNNMVLNAVRGISGNGDWAGETSSPAIDYGVPDAGSNIDWSSIINTSVNGGMNLLKTVISQPKPGQYIMTNPNGQSVNYQLPVGADASSMTFPNIGTSLGGSSTWIVLALVPRYW
jgi:hypothetical protein